MAWVQSRKRGEAPPKAKASQAAKTYVILGYLAAITAFMFWYGGFVQTDLILVLLLLGVAVLGQTRAFLRDWSPFIVLLFAWQLLRGYADNAAEGLGMPLHSADIIAAERALFGGHLPNAVLQRALYVPGQLHWYDIAATAFWAFHFVLPILFAFLLWTRDRAQFRQFTSALLLLSFAGFATYILFPAVPPWLAATPGRGELTEPIALIRLAVVERLHYGPTVSLVMQGANPDLVAAMPSLHAAYPTLVLLFTIAYWRRLIPLAFGYCCGLWFSIVYIGDHYVVDALVGILYAALAFLAIYGLGRLRERRRLVAPQAPAPGPSPASGPIDLVGDQ